MRSFFTVEVSWSTSISTPYLGLSRYQSVYFINLSQIVNWFQTETMPTSHAGTCRVLLWYTRITMNVLKVSPRPCKLLIKGFNSTFHLLNFQDHHSTLKVDWKLAVLKLNSYQFSRPSQSNLVQTVHGDIILAVLGVLSISAHVHIVFLRIPNLILAVVKLTNLVMNAPMCAVQTQPIVRGIHTCNITAVYGTSNQLQLDSWNWVCRSARFLERFPTFCESNHETVYGTHAAHSSLLSPLLHTEIFHLVSVLCSSTPTWFKPHIMLSLVYYGSSLTWIDRISEEIFPGN